MTITDHYNKRRTGTLGALMLMLLGAFAPLASYTAAAQETRPGGGPPLLTRWAKEMDPARPLPEYPRPQMTRKDWQSLNGPWQFEFGSQPWPVTPTGPGEAPPLGRELTGKIIVPFPVESALSGVGKRPANSVWYRRTFTVPPAWRAGGKRILLHFGAVNWESAAYVNGKPLGTHRGGYDAFQYDITDALTGAGAQELVVGAYNPADAGDQPRGKQVNKPGGIYYTPSTGIWQSVWLEPVPEAHVARLILTPDRSGKAELRLTVRAGGQMAAGLEVRAEATGPGGKVGSAAGKPGVEMRIPISRARLWSPEDPFLYGLRVTLRRNGKPVDTVGSYFALRTVERSADERGIQRLKLNGKFVFQMGVLDQGFWPDGLYTAPTDAALRYDIEIAKKLGFNLIRKHVKVEPQRWYYWADKLGVLVWQDMPSGGGRIGPNDPDLKPSVAMTQQFEQELREMIEEKHNHPSVILWVVFNEGWGQFDTERITRQTKAMDPSRLVINASGWTDRGVGDAMDMHKYPSPGSPKPEPARAAVLGEFGGLGLPIEGHMWEKTNWGYQGMTSADQLLQKYEQFQRTVYRLKDDPGLSAAVYTQLTDVETESNGLLTYDRAVIKTDLNRIAKANRGQLPPAPVLIEAVPTSQAQPVEWRYTFDRPADDSWFRADFSDSVWKAGPGGFGTRGTPGAVVRTEWNTPDVWLRRAFTWNSGDTARNPHLLIHHDEDVEVYINGILAAKMTGYTGDYEEVPMSAAARAALKPGSNVLAIHCRQTVGGQYIDVGIVVEKAK